MLSTWGYQYLQIGLALAFAEVDLQRHLRQRGQSLNLIPPGDIIDPDDPAIRTLDERLDTILGFSQDHAQDLGAIPGNIVALKAKILAARKNANALSRSLQTAEILNDVTRIKNDFALILSDRSFYYLEPNISDYYGKPELFGPEIAKKPIRRSIEAPPAALLMAPGFPGNFLIDARTIARKRPPAASLSRRLSATVLARLTAAEK